MKKFLIIRFSSIGDIVLTTPVLRSLRKAYPDSEIHFLSKKAFEPLLQFNPYIDRLQFYEGELLPLLRRLRRERYDHVLDLHHNLRSGLIRLLLGRPSSVFPKQNLDKALMTLPALRGLARALPHVVQRYAQTLKPLQAPLDEGGLDFFLPPEKEAWGRQSITQHLPGHPLAVALGAQHATKRWPAAAFVPLLNELGRPVLLLGGADAAQDAAQIGQELRVPVWNTAGRYGLLESAALLKACDTVLAHDTGFMHIAAAFGKQLYVLWGNTVPAFGMYPYRTAHHNLEVTGLSCRPCSRIGYEACPKGHFRCMRELSPGQVLRVMREGTE